MPPLRAMPWLCYGPHNYLLDGSNIIKTLKVWVKLSHCSKETVPVDDS